MTALPIAAAGASFAPEEIEAGRRLFAREWRFAAAAVDLGAVPPPGPAEVAFAGRSNVGKSSLINALTGRRALARTSRTPGRTQQLVFFSSGGPLRLVDLPGYGYAAAPRSKVTAWTGLIDEYLAQRASLARVYVLIDARRALSSADLPFLDRLDRLGVSYQLLLTKTDAVGSDDLDRVIADTGRAIAARPAALPEVGRASALTGSGIPEIRAGIARLAAERQARSPR